MTDFVKMGLKIFEDKFWNICGFNSFYRNY